MSLTRITQPPPIFIFRRNPLKNHNSAQRIQGNPSNFPCIALQATRALVELSTSRRFRP
jgi:hypothetical protein